MNVDTSKLQPKPGDVVLVRATVEGVESDCVSLRFDWKGEHVFLKNRDIAAIEPRPIKVGDRVRPSADYDPTTKLKVIGIDGKYAWVQYGDGSRGTRYLPDLTRLPDTEQGEG